MIIPKEELERLARGLTEAQRRAIFPGPGNPDYARGPRASMLAMERRGLVSQVNHWTTNRACGARLTELGAALRAHLEQETGHAI